MQPFLWIQHIPHHHKISSILRRSFHTFAFKHSGAAQSNMVALALRQRGRCCRQCQSYCSRVATLLRQPKPTGAREWPCWEREGRGTSALRRSFSAPDSAGLRCQWLMEWKSLIFAKGLSHSDPSSWRHIANACTGFVLPAQAVINCVHPLRICLHAPK